MKDIHCHLLYGIDDGSKSLDESIKLLKKMAAAGVTEVCLTPHYVINSQYNASPLLKKRIFIELITRMKQENINIKLYIGNEILMDPNVCKYLKNNLIESINKSSYILLELPFFIKDSSVLNIFSEIMSSGYKIILAHPERYQYLYKDFETLDIYKDMGVYFQVNYESLYGKYGRKAKKMAKLLLKKGYVSFLAGDIHHSVNLNLKRLKRKLKKLVKEEEIDKILNSNFSKVVANLDL